MRKKKKKKELEIIVQLRGSEQVSWEPVPFIEKQYSRIDSQILLL